MGTLLDKYRKEYLARSSNKQEQARAWLYKTLQDMRMNRVKLIAGSTYSASIPVIGKMYFFFYNPKTRKELPYYDRFPLILPTDYHIDGFLALNLHYLDPGNRIKLLDTLSQFKNNSKYDATTKLRLSYQVLTNVSKTEAFRPCLKKYLYSFIQSKFLEVPANDWDMACFLPAESFVKARKEQVWQDSIKQIEDN